MSQIPPPSSPDPFAAQAGQGPHDPPVGVGSAPAPSGAASGKPSSKTPRAERDLILQAIDAAQTPRSGGFNFPGDLPPPGTFPGYELIREVHRGGQGAVFLAVQLATKRRVAIKLMHGGPFRGSAGKARFEREVQILGQLNHPNIVRIHDSGATTDGSHFYVMDYVSGRSLDETIAGDKRPPVEDTLRLFLKICEGINAAHLKGIIHRDIKPSNIRISTSGEPVVVDFGLAKVSMLGGSSADTPAIMSMTGQFIGSLPWASPEQAQGVHENVDVRTDVYSLGVVLYQLLTGKFPYDVIGNMRDVLDRILRAEPARPSTVRRQINDEVETIVLKCLAKERERRYQSAGELARDIERYLSGQPIEAKRDSVLYIITKTARRYWVPAAAMAGVVSALIVFAVIMSVLYRAKSLAQANLALALDKQDQLLKQTEEQLGVITQSREAERIERRKAEAATEAALTPARQMIFVIDPMLRNLVGATPVRMAFLKHAMEYLQRLESKVGDDPAILAETAAVHQRMGEMMASMFSKRIGDTDQGVEHFNQALKLREKLLTLQPADPIAKADLGRSIKSLAENLRLDQKAADAKPQFERALQLLDEGLAKLPPASDQRARIEADRADCLTGIGSCLARLTLLARTSEEAAALQQQSEASYAAVEDFWSARRDAQPGDPAFARRALAARNAQAEYLISGVIARYRRDKKYDLALAAADRADALMARAIPQLSALADQRPQDRDLKRDLEISHHFAGWALQERAAVIDQQARDAGGAPNPEYIPTLLRGREHFTQAQAIAAALQSADISDLEAQRDLATISNKLGNMERELGRVQDPARFAAATQHFEKSLALRRSLSRSDPITRHTADLNVGLIKLADLQRELASSQADPAQAVQLYTQAMDRYQEALRLSLDLVDQKVQPPDWNVIPEVKKGLAECQDKVKTLGERK